MVLLLGKDLVGWVSRASNLDLLTNTTQEQVRIGIQISRDIASVDELTDTIRKCLDRSPDWTQFHADALADATTRPAVDSGSVDIAATERRYFTQLYSGYHGKAVSVIEKFVRENDGLDPKLKGWLLELGARAAHNSGNTMKREQLQREAYSWNKNVHRPVSGTQYAPLINPTKQADTIVRTSNNSLSSEARSLTSSELRISWYPPRPAINLKRVSRILGEVLGFSSERPEKEQGVGPDVLWVLDDNTAWIMEAKAGNNQTIDLPRQNTVSCCNHMSGFRSTILKR